MTDAGIAGRRLRNQRLTGPALRQPEDVVAWFGAVQAQEFEPALWALGLRLPATAAADAVEQAFAEGRLLRTHVMRPTWHFVAPADLRWLQALTAPRVQRLMASYNRQLELDARTFTRALRLIERALGGGHFLTRAELAEVLDRGGVAARGQRLAHVMMHAELECLVCSGPRRGRQFTYALVAERAPQARPRPREESLADLASRFFRGHGPATLRDFSWWSGLTVADGRAAVAMIGATRETVDGLDYYSLGQVSRSPGRDHPAHLLPIYDEYLVAYRDRAAVPHGPGTIATPREAIIFQHAMVIDGQIAGTWRTAAGDPQPTLVPLRALKPGERRALADAQRRYERFVRR